MSEGNGHATRETFFGKGFVRRFKEVDVPGLGKKVKVGNQSERERQAFEAWLVDKKGEVIRARAKVARLKYIVDNTYSSEDESRLFSDSDIPQLCDVDYAITDKLFDEIKEWLGLNGADLEQLEQRAKNSPSVPVAASQ